jgi:ketosteroid isomerase-like protein
VGRFFRELAEVAELELFQPRAYFAEGDMVVAVGHYQFRAKPTGRSWATDFAMVWTLGPNGAIDRFQALKDSAAEAAAFQVGS